MVGICNLIEERYLGEKISPKKEKKKKFRISKKYTQKIEIEITEVKKC